jgi:hypothetical protein
MQHRPHSEGGTGGTQPAGYAGAKNDNRYGTLNSFIHGSTWTVRSCGLKTGGIAVKMKSPIYMNMDVLSIINI